MSKAWRAKDPGRARKLVREADKRYREADSDYQAKKSARKYGLSLEDYKRLTSGVCEICKTRKATCLDHCHRTGQNRGGLCSNCNAALGHFDDNVEWLQSAIMYLGSVSPLSDKESKG